jgi:hypothetical protein
LWCCFVAALNDPPTAHANFQAGRLPLAFPALHTSRHTILYNYACYGSAAQPFRLDTFITTMLSAAWLSRGERTVRSACLSGV